MAVEQAVVNPVADMELARVVDRVDRVIGIVEEAEVHIFQQFSCLGPKRRLDVADHHQGGS